MLGGACRVSRRRIHHHDPLARGRWEVDIVDSDARPHDRLEPRLIFQEGGGQLGGATNDDAVGLVERFAHLLGSQARSDVDFDFSRLLEDFEPGRGQVIGDQNAIHGKASFEERGPYQLYG